MHINKRLPLIIVVALMLTAGIYAIYLTWPAPDSVLVDAAEGAGATGVADEALPGTVAAEGVVVPVESVSLAFHVSGRVAEILVEEGQVVEAGEPLLRLGGQAQEIDLALAEIALLKAAADVAAAEAGLAAATVELEAAGVAVAEAEAKLALQIAGPTDEAVALENAMIGAAQAAVQQAVGNQAMVLEAVTPAQIQSAEAELAAAQAQLVVAREDNQRATTSGNATEEQLNQSQLNLDAALARVETAQARLNELHAGATDAERQAVSGAVGAASQQVNAAEAELDLLLAGPRPEAAAVLEAQVEQARQGVAEAEIAVEQAETLVLQSQAAQAEAETAVQQAQALLDKTILVAPFTGTVASIETKVGEGVQAQTPVLTLADFSEWRMETIQLTELDVVGFEEGEAVEVKFDAFPDRVVGGQVLNVSTRIDPANQGNIAYVVTFSLDDVDLPLRWGMTAIVYRRNSSS